MYDYVLDLEKQWSQLCKVCASCYLCNLPKEINECLEYTIALLEHVKEI